MAAGMSLSEISGILECAVCLETVCNPKTLVCNHSYCKRCLDDLLQFGANGTAVIKCPKSCKKTTKLSNNQTTNDLGVDYMLKNVVDVMIAKDKRQDVNKKKFKCESGEDCVRDVIAYCMICDSFICQPCSCKHNKCEQANPFVPVSFHHNGEQLNVLCKTHATDAAYICCNNEFICLYCLHRNHKGHSYDTLDNEAAQLRGMLSKEIEQMGTFTQCINVNLREAESDISMAKDSLEKLLRLKKLKCISDYVDYLNKEEVQIIEEFNLVGTNHIEEFCIADPTEYYKEYLSTEGIKILLQKGPILNTVKGFVGKKKNIQEVIVSLSDHTFNHVHPLGNLDITLGRTRKIDKAKKTFKSKLTTEGVDDVSAKLLQNIQYLCQEALGYKFQKFSITRHGKAREQGRSSDDSSNIFNNDANEEETGRTYGHRDVKQVTASSKPKKHTPSDVSNDLFGTMLKGYDNEKELINECLKKFQEDGIDYIEDLIQSGKNDELYILLREQPSMINMVSNNAPFFNLPIHMAAKYNNIEFLKELIRYDSSMIGFKNNLGSNALHASASYTSANECFIWLVQRYPDMLENKNDNGHTVLHVAASRNVLEAVKVLLNYEANILEEDNDGNTPLDLAKTYGCTDIIQLLLERMPEEEYWGE